VVSVIALKEKVAEMDWGVDLADIFSDINKAFGVSVAGDAHSQMFRSSTIRTVDDLADIIARVSTLNNHANFPDFGDRSNVLPLLIAILADRLSRDVVTIRPQSDLWKDLHL